MDSAKSYLTQVAIRYLSYRPRFSHELVVKLKQVARQKDFSDCQELIDAIIAKLTKAGFVNDEDLAGQYVSSQLNSKIKGPRFISLRLRHFGLSNSLISQVLDEFASVELQKQVITDYIGRKKITPIKLFRRLISRGFAPSLVSSLIDADRF
jgi:SOS response regulatory protein OraA/RecX